MESKYNNGYKFSVFYAPVIMKTLIIYCEMILYIWILSVFWNLMFFIFLFRYLLDITSNTQRDQADSVSVNSQYYLLGSFLQKEDSKVIR